MLLQCLKFINENNVHKNKQIRFPMKAITLIRAFEFDVVNLDYGNIPIINKSVHVLIMYVGHGF